MAAQASIADVLSALDPNRPLEGEALTNLYVERQPPVHRRLAQLLQPAGAKIALWGQSGSGKSTEISKLQLEREGHERYIVVSPGVRHDLSRIGLSELAAEATFSAILAANSRGIALSSPLRKRLESIGIHSRENGSGWALDPKVVATDSPAYVFQESAIALAEIESGLGHPLVLLFDGLEKLGVQQAAAIFGSNGEALARWPVRALFVVPPLLIYAPEWAGISEYVKDTIPLPAMGFRLEPDALASKLFFQELARKRLAQVSLRLDPGLLDLAIEKSGGLPRQLIQILRETFIESSLEALQTPNVQCLERALGRIRNGFLLKLQPGQEERLAAVHRNLPLSVSREDHELIAMGCIIQYQAGTHLWHDVNPVLEAA